MSVLTLFTTNTGIDVVHKHLCTPYLSLKDMSNLSRITKYTYYKLHQRDQALYVMRQIWSLPCLSLFDKINTICKTNLYKAVVHVWYMEHPPPKTLCSSLHYMQVAVAQANPSIIRFLTTHLHYGTKHAENVPNFYINTVVNLMKNGHEELALQVFSNANGEWWTQFNEFVDADKYTCWKEAVKYGAYHLEERMLATFATEEERTNDCPSLRLLAAVESLNIEVFQHYYENAGAMTVEKKRELLQHGHFKLLQDGVRRGAMTRRDFNKLEKMANYLVVTMRALANA